MLKRSLLGWVAIVLILGTSAQAQERDLAKENANLRIVIDFYERFFQKQDLSAADQYIQEDYIQHNPRVADGRAPLIEVFKRVFAANPNRENRILRSGTSGDLVFLHVYSKSNSEDRGRVIAEVFRIEEGMIAEHWDVMQDIPEEAANSNGML